MNHSIPVEMVVVHLLALASALAGNLISSRPTNSTPVPARFSALFQSEDLGIPCWMDQELGELLRRQHSATGVGLPPGFRQKPMRELRRQLQTLKALGGENNIEACFLERAIEIEKYRKSFRHLLPAGSCRSGFGQSAEHPGGAPAFFVRDAKDLKTLFRVGGCHENSSSDRGDLFKEGTTVLGWVNKQSLGKLIKRFGPASRVNLGWIFDCPVATLPSEYAVQSGFAASPLLRRLEYIRFSKARYIFEPPVAGIELLDLQVENVHLNLKKLPEDQRLVAVPDVFLGWHLSALLCALCGDDDHAPDPTSARLCAEIGMVLAESVIQNHIHHFRRSFPADRSAPLTGIDRRMFRLLPENPCSVRDMQRRFHGMRKAECLGSLNKLTALELAIEFSDGCFSKAPPPQPLLCLSDFWSVYGLKSEFDPDTSTKSTANTASTSPLP